MGDELVEQRYVFFAECPVCYDRFGEFDTDEEAIRAARRCYFSHDETPVPDEDEAEYIGLDGTLMCYADVELDIPLESIGCGWECEKRRAPYDALSFSKCPGCGEYTVGDKESLVKSLGDEM